MHALAMTAPHPCLPYNRGGAERSEAEGCQAANHVCTCLHTPHPSWLRHATFPSRGRLWCGANHQVCHCEERSDVDFERPPPVAESRERRSWADTCLGANEVKREGLVSTRKSQGSAMQTISDGSQNRFPEIATASSKPRNDTIRTAPHQRPPCAKGGCQRS